MRKGGFHYKPSYGVPRKWQELIYTIGLLYNEKSECAALVDSCILKVAPSCYHALKQCIVRGDSPTKVSIDFFIARSVMYEMLKDYYVAMYYAIKHNDRQV